MPEKILSKYELARSRNKRLQKFGELKIKLSKNLKLEWLKDEDVLFDLRKSINLDDRLYKRILGLRKSNELTVNENLNRKYFKNCMREFLALLGNPMLFLFMSNWRSIGAIKIKADELSNCAMDLLDIDGDTPHDVAAGGAEGGADWQTHGEPS